LSLIDFPIDVFPKQIRHLLQNLPTVVGSRPEYGALGVLWATSICAPETKVEIKDNYRIGLNIYGAIVAPKGDAKTPALGFTTGPIMKEIEGEISRYNKSFAMWSKRLEVLKKDRTKRGAELLDDHLMKEPASPWYGVITEGTTEGIRDTAKQNNEWEHPAMIGQFSEELDGWVKGMGKYASGGGKDGGEMGFYLKAYDGAMSIKANKGEKDSTPKFRLGLLGTIQPKVFQEAFDGKIDNGLMDRFIIVTGIGGGLKNPNPYDVFIGDVVKDYDDFMSDLFEDEHPKVLKLTDEAMKLGLEMFDWLCSTDDKYNAEAKSKWWVHFHKICGLLCVIWKKDKVDATIMEKAISLTKYLVTSWCMAFKVMNLTDVDEVEKKVTESLRLGPCSRSKLSSKLSQKLRGSLDLALNNMYESGMIEDRIRKSSNGREVSEISIV